MKWFDLPMGFPPSVQVTEKKRLELERKAKIRLERDIAAMGYIMVPGSFQAKWRNKYKGTATARGVRNLKKNNGAPDGVST